MSNSKFIKPGKWYIDYDGNGKRTAYVYEDSACQLLGFKSREDYINSLGSWDGAIHPDDMMRVNLLIADVEAKHPEGMDFDAEYRIMTKQGYRLIHDYGHVLRNKEGYPVHVDGVAFDIQDIAEKENVAEQTRLQKEQLEIKQTQLEESLAFVNFFLNQFVSAYYINLDDYGCKTYKRTDELDEKYPIAGNYYLSLKKYIDEAVHPDDRIELLKIVKPENIRRALKDTPGFYKIFRDISNGTERHYKIQIIRGADEIHAALGFEDITEEFYDQERRLLGAVPLSPDVLTKANIGLWSFELDEGCAPRMYADEAMLKLLGLRHQIAPEDTYHAWFDYIDEASYDLVNDAVEKMINGEHAEVQYPWHHPNGETCIVRCGGIRNLEYTKGVRIEGTHQDVTALLHYDEEQRKREEQQRKDEIARVKAEASDKAKTEFLFNMSHDIRTPMNAILGYTDIAIKHIDDINRVNENLGKIKVAGGHLLNLINDILEMSRIEAGKLEILEQPVDIRKLIDGVEQMSSSLAIAKSIDFGTEIIKLENPYVYCDVLHENEILINLISNAIKYTKEGGEVRLKVTQLNGTEDGRITLRFEVTDNGIGMSEEFQNHLFEAFSRENTSTVSRQEGAGLGLSIVKNIVDLSGGIIRVKSKLGEGSVFTVEIPMRVMDEKSIRVFEEENKPLEIDEGFCGFNNKKVLLVEDNEMNREIAKDILEDVGLIVDVAYDGELALRTVTERGIDYYDFILMDIQMPVMDGYTATRAIRALPGGDKAIIIALSANAFEEDITKSLESGMNAHAVKPIDTKALLETIQELIK